jgi:anti-sigma B factor antagonist
MSRFGGSATPPRLDLGCTARHTGSTTLVVDGEIDMTTGDRFRHALVLALAEPGLEQLTVDVGRLQFIDSHGVSALIWAAQLAEDRGIGFAVTNAAGQTRTILEVLGVYELLTGGGD